MSQLTPSTMQLFVWNCTYDPFNKSLLTKSNLACNFIWRTYVMGTLFLMPLVSTPITINHICKRSSNVLRVVVQMPIYPQPSHFWHSPFPCSLLCSKIVQYAPVCHNRTTSFALPWRWIVCFDLTRHRRRIITSRLLLLALRHLLHQMWCHVLHCQLLHQHGHLVVEYLKGLMFGISKEMQQH